MVTHFSILVTVESLDIVTQSLQSLAYFHNLLLEEFLATLSSFEVGIFPSKISGLLYKVSHMFLDPECQTKYLAMTGAIDSMVTLRMLTVCFWSTTAF
jgi:hypothetical protein